MSYAVILVFISAVAVYLNIYKYAGARLGGGGCAVLLDGDWKAMPPSRLAAHCVARASLCLSARPPVCLSSVPA